MHEMLMWEPTGCTRRLAARSTPSVIALGRSKSPCYSPLSFQPNPSLTISSASCALPL